MKSCGWRVGYILLSASSTAAFSAAMAPLFDNNPAQMAVTGFIAGVFVFSLVSAVLARWLR